jgi:hypothetical protein
LFRFPYVSFCEIEKLSQILKGKMVGQIWRNMNGGMVTFMANAFSFVALIYEGCNQGVMGTVSANPDFVNVHTLGDGDGKITKPLKQGYAVTIALKALANIIRSEDWWPSTILLPCLAVSSAAGWGTRSVADEVFSSVV